MPSQPTIHLRPGTRLLERYAIIDRIASGGMAWIYRATDERLDRTVCVKLLRLVLEGKGSKIYQATYSHFLREAVALSQLQHPNTLRIYDFGFLEDGRPFQISEFLDGGNLDAHVRRRGPLGGDEVISILEPITGAVSEAHQHKIIHRDIKPSNIFLARVVSGDRDVLMPKLGDFGIAQSDLRMKQPKDGRPGDFDPDNTDSFSTVALFSPCWAAPEQLSGVGEGPSTDVYALGLVSTFMLAGEMPFHDRDVHQTFGGRVTGDELVQSRLQELCLEGEVARVLSAAMTANPKERIPTPAQFFEQMRGALLQAGRSPAPPVARVSTAQPEPASGPVANVPPAVAFSPSTPAQSGIIVAPARPAERPALAKITLEVDRGKEREKRRRTASSDKTASVGQRTAHFLEIDERLDFTAVDELGAETRFRVTLLPARQAVNIKGLNCFVAKPDGRPTPALAATTDGTVEFISSAHRKLGELAWSFGHLGPSGRVFSVDGEELVVPLEAANEAVAVHMRRGGDLFVLRRRG